MNAPANIQAGQGTPDFAASGSWARAWLAFRHTPHQQLCAAWIADRSGYDMELAMCARSVSRGDPTWAPSSARMLDALADEALAGCSPFQMGEAA